MNNKSSTDNQLQCDYQKQCDTRYVLKVWLYGVAVVAVLGSLGIVFGAGTWKENVDHTVIDLKYRVDRVENFSNKLDTVLILLKQRNSESPIR